MLNSFLLYYGRNGLQEFTTDLALNTIQYAIRINTITDQHFGRSARDYVRIDRLVGRSLALHKIGTFDLNYLPE